MPSDFVPKLPCKFYRDNDGIIRNNMNFTTRYKGGTKIYVKETGNDTTGGLIVNINGCYSILYDCHVKKCPCVRNIHVYINKRECLNFHVCF